MSLSSDVVDALNNKVQVHQAPINCPSIADIAEKLGHNITETTEEDLKKQIEEEEKGGKSGGGSGFSWSF